MNEYCYKHCGQELKPNLTILFLKELLNKAKAFFDISN